MLKALLVVLPLLAAAAVGHWVARPTTSMGRRRFPAVTVSALLVLTLVVAVPVWRRHQLQGRLSRVASALVGHKVTVRCDSGIHEATKPGAELGSVAFDASGRPGSVAVLSDQTCTDLQHHRWNISVHVLSHESAHLAGQPVEALAECHAVQTDARTAMLLGLDHARAVALARTYFRDTYPLLPGDYTSHDCVAGGALDEHLPDPPW